MRSSSRGYVRLLISFLPSFTHPVCTTSFARLSSYASSLCVSPYLRDPVSSSCFYPYHAAAMFLPYAFESARLQYLRSPQGKVAELRLELNSGGKKDKNFAAKKTALKKIVANMTMSNNDMVALFPDIVGCMHIPSLEIKKMWVDRSARRTDRG